MRNRQNVCGHVDGFVKTVCHLAMERLVGLFKVVFFFFFFFGGGQKPYASIMIVLG